MCHNWLDVNMIQNRKNKIFHLFITMMIYKVRNEARGFNEAMHMQVVREETCVSIFPREYRYYTMEEKSYSKARQMLPINNGALIPLPTCNLIKKK